MFRTASRITIEEFERLRATGAVGAGVTLGREEILETPIEVRALADDETLTWAASLSAALDVRSGVVGISGVEQGLAAHVAVRLAAWIGGQGQTVVLVDGCVESPVLARPLADDPDEGLVDAVLYGVSPQRVLRRTLAPSVSVVTAGSQPVSIDGLFSDDNYARTLRALAGTGLALVVLAPVRLPKIAAALDALVAVGESGRDLTSIASAAEGTRVVSVLVGPPQARDEHPAAATGPGEAVTLESGQEVHPIEPTEPSGEGVEPPPERPAPEEEQVAPPTEGVLALTSATKAGAVAEDASVRREPEAEDALLQVETAGGGSETGRPRRRGGVIAASALVLLIACVVVWWGVDGRRRTRSRQDRMGSAVERPERTASGGPGGAGTRQKPVDVAPSEVNEADHEVQAGPEGGPAVDSSTSAAMGSPATMTPAGTAESPGASQGEPGTASAPIIGPGGRYHVMISSQRRERDAGVEAEHLSNLGVETEIVPTEVESMGLWYRVNVSGGYPSYAAAVEVLDTIRSLGYEGAWIEVTPRNR